MMTHLTNEEWRGVMSVATSTEEATVHGKALAAWKDWNPEWLLDRVNAKGGDSSKVGFTIDDLMRCFMEAYLQGVAKKLTGD